MDRTLIFDYITYDSVLIEAGKTSYSFFQESEEQAESVTGMTEDMAVKWLMSNSSFRQMFVETFFAPPADVEAFLGVKSPFTNQNIKPGDIDLLLVDKQRPDQAFAFECKRVKVVTSAGNVPKVNNANKIAHGVKQANAYQSLGFHSTYLVIILLDDGRAMETPNTMFRYSKDASVENIYSIPQNESLHEEVGVIYIKVSQTTGKHINHGGGVGFCIDKLALKLSQKADMTQKVVELLNRHNAGKK